MYCIGGTPTSCTWTTERLPIGTLHGTGKTDQNLHNCDYLSYKTLYDYHTFHKHQSPNYDTCTWTNNFRDLPVSTLKLFNIAEGIRFHCNETSM